MVTYPSEAGKDDVLSISLNAQLGRLEAVVGLFLYSFPHEVSTHGGFIVGPTMRSYQDKWYSSVLIH